MRFCAPSRKRLGEGDLKALTADQVAKALIAGFALLLLANASEATAIASMLVALGGNGLYMLARLQLLQADQERQIRS